MKLKSILAILLFFPCVSIAAEFHSETISGSVIVKSWRDLRDERIVKQNLDYSCGAASVATILNQYYGFSLSEKDVLSKIGKNSEASFQDLARVVERFGFRGGGIALSFRDLLYLRAPVVAYLKYRGEDHFTVVRGVRPDGLIHVADPSWGNRRFSGAQFRKMWETRDDQTAKGKILLIVPRDQVNAEIDTTFFAEPKGLALSLQSIPLSGR